MVSEMLASEAHQQLFRQLAGGTGFELDVHDSPKRQFNILAKLHSWVGGEEPWNTHWEECFDETYIWRASVLSAPASPSGSDEVIESATSGSDDNIEATAASSDGNLEATASSSDGTSDASESFVTGIPLPLLSDSVVVFDTIWAHFEGFTPNPKSDFNTEFNRLADHQGWNEKERKRQRPEFLEAEFGTYYGKDNKSFSNWQNLCRVCKIDPVPESIEDCTEALKNVLVNIVNLVDSRRTGEGVIIFPTKRQFIDYTWPDCTYPLDEARSDTLLAALLRPVSRRKYWKEADKELKKFWAQRSR